MCWQTSCKQQLKGDLLWNDNIYIVDFSPLDSNEKAIKLIKHMKFDFMFKNLLPPSVWQFINNHLTLMGSISWNVINKPLYIQLALLYMAQWGFLSYNQVKYINYKINRNFVLFLASLFPLFSTRRCHLKQKRFHLRSISQQIYRAYARLEATRLTPASP